MIVSPPIPVTALVPGVVVLHAGKQRTVLGMVNHGTIVSLVLEGLEHLTYHLTIDQTVQIVIVDTGAAIETLRAAGLNPEIITTEE